MIVLEPNTTNSITFTSREFNVLNEVIVNLYSEGERSNKQINVIATYSNGQITFTLSELLMNNSFYFMVLTQGNKELCKIKAFCTDQDTNADSYQISKGEFITPTQSNNDFIVL